MDAVMRTIRSDFSFKTVRFSGFERGNRLDKGYVDIHCHLLPGVDDGAKDKETAGRMLRQAWEDGTRAMVLTPHYNPGRFQASNGEIEQKWRQLQETARQIHPDFKIYLGSECKFHSDSCEQMESGACRAMAGSRYMLVEFNVQESAKRIRRALYEVTLAGFRPILAHVERYQELHKDYDSISELIDSGVCIQVNAGSIAGKDGLRIAFFVHKLLAYEMVHLIGSDAHDDTRRSPVLSECAAYIRKKYGDSYVRQLMWDNPVRMLRDEEIL
jgi:protein-tyrosine phosphatase